jgi:hypothetical protein
MTDTRQREAEAVALKEPSPGGLNLSRVLQHPSLFQQREAEAVALKEPSPGGLNLSGVLQHPSLFQPDALASGFS